MLGLFFCCIRLYNRQQAADRYRWQCQRVRHKSSFLYIGRHGRAYYNLVHGLRETKFSLFFFLAQNPAHPTAFPPLTCCPCFCFTDPRSPCFMIFLDFGGAPWDQGSWWALPAANYMPILDTSGLGGMRSGWNQGAKCQGGAGCVG